MAKSYIRLIRVHHYIKNILVFAALACSGQMFSRDRLLSCVAAFFAFCCISSVVYIINDIKDVNKDSIHPTKCRRPIASGKISVKNACVMAVILFILAMVFNAFVFRISSTTVLLSYLLLNVAYSFGLKNIPILDITILVSGFIIRILYGAIVTDTKISNWLYLTVIVISFYFALGKRRNELKQSVDGETRKVLQSYSMGFLDKSMVMCLSLANVFYALWSMADDTVKLYNTDRLVLTVPVVLLITLKYSMDIEGDSDGDPVEVLLHDKVLLALCVLYVTVMFVFLYIY